MLTCDICGRAHAWFDCPDRGKMPAGWKPDRLTKSTAAPVSEPRLGKSTPGKGASRTVPQASHADNRVGAADKAPPQQPALRTGVASGAVGTISKPKKPRKAKPSVDDLKAAGVIVPASEAPAPKKRGRPATGFDKRAYDRDYAKSRRASKRAKKPSE